MASSTRTRISKRRPAARRPAKAVAKTAPSVIKKTGAAVVGKTAPNIKKPVLTPSMVPAVSAQPVKASNDAKPAQLPTKKTKLVRDRFSFPESDYAQFAALKKRAAAAGREVKKSELLRAGLALLSSMSDAELILRLSKIERIVTKKPGKDKSAKPNS